MKKAIFVLVILMHASVVNALPTVKATIVVVDENGVPISNAKASLTLNEPKKQGWGSVINNVRGFTDSEGMFVGSGESEPIINYGAEAEGFYASYHRYTKFTGVKGVFGFRRWQPWNPTLKIVLKKVKNPIAMYAYRVNRVNFQKKNDYVGYDLVKHDWVAPYGSGATTDFLIKISSEVRARNDYKVEFNIKFVNELDGIQAFTSDPDMGSRLLSNYLAPLQGYKKEFSNTRESSPGTMTRSAFSEGRNHYFRTRCTKGVESCLYGKIYGDIKFRYETVSFSYYLNPSAGDPNVEFNLKRNLFKDLHPRHKLSIP